MIEIKLDPTKYLAQDNTCNIFSSLGFEGVKVCCLVSKLWNKIANHDQVWIAIVPGIKDIMKLDKNVVELTVRDYVKNHAVTSLEDSIHRFEEFNSDVSVKGSFKCFFPFNPGCRFNAKVQIGYSDWIGRTPKLKKQWICVKELPSDEIGYQIHEQFIPGLPLTPTVMNMIWDKLNPNLSWGLKSKSILPLRALVQLDNHLFNVIVKRIFSNEIAKRQQYRPYIAGSIVCVAVPLSYMLATLLIANAFIGNHTGT